VRFIADILPAMQRKPNRSKTPTDWGEVADWYYQLVGESGSEFHLTDLGNSL
jgi:hypothetical protein